MRATVRGWGRAARRAALPAAALVVLSVPSAVASTVARPSSRLAAEGACAGDSGVTVVVDFGTLGGGVHTRCAPEPVASGFEALTKAGFTYTGTTRFPGLLCRIDGQPADDPCVNAPSPTYYWAYWLAPEPGGPWTYSDLGAGNRDPAPGSVEGWAFSDGCKRQPGAPTACPGSPVTTTTSAAPAAPTTVTTAPAGAGGTPEPAADGGAGVAPGAPGASAGAPPDSAAGGVEDPRAAGAGSAGSGSDGSAAARDRAGEGVALGAHRDVVTTDEARGGSPAGALAGAAAAVALGLAAAGRVRARRRPTASGPGTE